MSLSKKGTRKIIVNGICYRWRVSQYRIVSDWRVDTEVLIEIDIFVDDPTHRVVIEIQRERYDYDFDRFWHYHIASQLELVKSHKEYQLERTVYTIVLLASCVKNNITGV